MVMLYDLVLGIYHWCIWLTSPFHKKANLWITGRKTAKSTILKHLKNEKVVWMHCASLGEFEQGRPVLEAISKQWPKYKILLTFYSPSGYEIRKEYPLADCVAYLPKDTKKNAQWLVDNLDIQASIFVKYDLWYHYLNQLQQKRIPCFLIAALFRRSQFYFQWYGAFLRKKITGFDHIFAQETSSLQLLNEFQIDNCSVAGDTRIDRVYAISQQADQYPILETFKGNKKLLIAGSTWSPDEQILIPFINKQENKDLKFVIAPHDIQPANLQRIEAGLTVPFVRYSQAKNSDLTTDQVLLIDNIGMLAFLYRYAWVVYIGGGFDKGLHNTLEPAAFGCPLVFGPNYDKFVEAVELVKTKSAFPIQHLKDFEAALTDLHNQDNYDAAANGSQEFIQQHLGATDRVIQVIQKYL